MVIQAHRRKTAEVLTVTPEQAARWLEDYAFPEQRKRRPEWVAELVALLRSDEWEGGMVKLHEVDGGWYLVDGQHRLWAIVESGIPGEMVVERTHGSTMEAAKAAYNRTDGGIPRTAGEAFRVSGVAESFGIRPTYCEKVLYAARFVRNGYRDAGAMKGFRANDAKLNLMREWGEPAASYLRSIKGINAAMGRVSRAAGPMAVGMTLFKHKPSDALEFYEALTENSGLEKGDPIHTLVQCLCSPHTMGKSQAYRARAVANCWNAWLNQQPLSIIRVDETIELHLAGTPLRPRYRTRPGES